MPSCDRSGPLLLLRVTAESDKSPIIVVSPTERIPEVNPNYGVRCGSSNSVVSGAADGGRKRDEDGPVAFAGDAQGAVAEVFAEVVDVRAVASSWSGGSDIWNARRAARPKSWSSRGTVRGLGVSVRLARSGGPVEFERVVLAVGESGRGR